MSTKKVAVLGAGSWGSALAILLANNNQSVFLWDHNPAVLEEIKSSRTNERYLPGVRFPELSLCMRPEEALESAEVVLLVIPSHAFEEVIQKLQPLVQPSHKLLWATKGLELKTGRFLHEVFEGVFDVERPYAVLSGPSFAREVAEGVPTAVALASKNLDFAEEVASCFASQKFQIETTDDVVGLQLGGVFKNVLAVAVGLSDGLGFGANTRAALMTKGLAQMMTLGKSLGARSETFMGLSGCGDTILTCTDNQSRNRRFGLALAEGLSEKEALERIGQVVEAVYNIEQLHRLAGEHQVELPIVELMFRVMKQGVNPREAIGSLFYSTK